MSTDRLSAPPRSAALLLGFSLGGFFDGILLHQVLQWHHLLSNVASPRVQDLRVQLLADGLFHLLMYGLALAALLLLWRRRGGLAAPGSGRTIAAAALLGFGAWHVVDTLLSHWITGIHRVRGDSPNPLFWDLLWLAAFGIVPLVIGWWLQRRGPGSRTPGERAAQGLASLVLAAGIVSLWPAGAQVESGEVVVVFKPGTTASQAFDALARHDARVRWVDASGSVWAVALPPSGSAMALYAKGALLVSRTPVPVGCLAWLRLPAV